MLSFFDEWLERVNHVSRDRGQIETFRTDLNQAVTDARQVQELVHESHECLRLGIDRVEQFDRCGILVALPQQVDGVRDWRQRVSELMSQHGDELIPPLAFGDEPRRPVRARGGIVDPVQQLLSPVIIPGDSPRAQRHPLVLRRWLALKPQPPLTNPQEDHQRDDQHMEQPVGEDDDLVAGQIGNSVDRRGRQRPPSPACQAEVHDDDNEPVL